MKDELGLELHEGKVKLRSVWQGIDFLGWYVKPHRRYVRRSTFARMVSKLTQVSQEEPFRKWQLLKSYTGMLTHGRNHRLQLKLFRMSKN